MSVTVVSSDLRRAVIERDGTRCLKCGVQCTPDWWGPTALHIDHIRPESKGGPTILSNLQVLCRTCNLSKGATYADYRKAQGSNFGAEVAAAGLVIVLCLAFPAGWLWLMGAWLAAVAWAVLLVGWLVGVGCWLAQPRHGMSRQRQQEIELLMAYEMRRRAIELSQLRTEREGATDGLR